MATKDNKNDAELAAVGAIPLSAGWYRLDVTTTSASITSLPAGRYIVVLDGVTTVAIGAAAVTEPASGAAVAVASAVMQTGWEYKHAAVANCHIVVLNAGSGRVYMVPAP